MMYLFFIESLRCLVFPSTMEINFVFGILVPPLFESLTSSSLFYQCADHDFIMAGNWEKVGPYSISFLNVISVVSMEMFLSTISRLCTLIVFKFSNIKLFFSLVFFFTSITVKHSLILQHARNSVFGYQRLFMNT